MRTLIVLVCSLLTAPLHGSELREVMEQANEAFRAEEPAAMATAMERARELRPYRNKYLYFLAMARARMGDSGTALRHLETLAARGLVLSVDDQPWLKSLRGRPDWQTLLARFQENGRPVGSPRVLARHPEGNFIPEGISASSNIEVLYLGSIRKRRIDMIEGGTSRPFYSGDPLMSVFGMHLTDDGETLWVATAGLDETRDLDTKRKGRTGLVTFDTASGQPVAEFLFPDNGTPHLLGEVILSSTGPVATDSLGGGIYRLSPESGRWDTLLPSGRLRSPQGLVQWTDARLVVADYVGGLYFLNRDDNRLTELNIPDDLAIEGIDGLYRHGSKLIAIQNGIRPQRVICMQVAGNEVISWQTLVANHPEFDDPNLGFVYDDHFAFIANSHWPRFDRNGDLPPAHSLTGPIVLTLPVPDNC